MPHNVLISKIRCSSPNKKGTAARNRNELNYIATRPGTDLELTSDDKKRLLQDMSDSGTYVKYICERPRSHGLFGNLDPQKIADLSGLSEDMYQMSKTKNIYRSIISLDKNDAFELGYITKDKWNVYLKGAMPDLANEFNIPIDKLQWVAAYHAEDSHPHVHVMFWRLDDVVQSPYIHVSKQNSCRELLSRKMFEEEYFNNVVSKTAARDLSLELGKDILEQEIKALTETLPLANSTEKLMPRVNTEQLSEINHELVELLGLLPEKGSLKYKYLPIHAKAQVDKVVTCMLKKTELNTEYQNYQKYIQTISATYSAAKDERNKTMDKALKDLNKRLGNLVLKNIKPLISMRDYYVNSIANMADCTVDEPDNLKSFVPEPSDSNVEIVIEKQMECLPIDDTIRDDFALHDDVIHDDLVSRDDVNPYANYVKQSASLGNDFALYKLGKLYYEAKDVEQDIDLAIKYLEKSAEQNNSYALYTLSKLYLDDEAGRYDVQKAIDYLERAASLGNDFALYKLGKLYLDDKTDRYDAQKAIGYFEQSASLGNDFAQYQLGKLYYEAKNVEQNIDLAIKYLEQSAEQGNSYALYTLGKLYLDDVVGRYDVQKAIGYFKQSASLDNDFAQYQLGKLYYEAKDVEQDIDLAIKYLEQSAGQDNSYALYTLGKIYSDPENRVYDIQNALRYLEHSASLDNDYAMLKLGNIHLWGKGVPKNESLGKYWLNLSMEKGNEFAEQSLKAYESFRLQYAISTSYSLLNSMFMALSSTNRADSQENQLNRNKTKSTRRKHRKKDDAESERHE